MKAKPTAHGACPNSSSESIHFPLHLHAAVSSSVKGWVGGGGMTFTINGRTFNPNRVDTRVSLGSVEEWDFINPTMMDHPIHIHTNPFQVLSSDGSPIRAWKDVVLVRANSRSRVRTAFRDFTGKAMYHCHIVDHEDLGMMGVLDPRLMSVRESVLVRRKQWRPSLDVRRADHESEPPSILNWTGTDVQSFSAGSVAPPSRIGIGSPQ